jgi:Fic family protein
LVRRRWPGDPGAPGGRANRVGFDYDAYLPGDIAGWELSIPAALATDVGRVEGALRDLSHREQGSASLLWPLLRTEAIASSRIEGLVVSHHRLALAAADAVRDPLAGSVLGNLGALRRALDLAQAPLTVGAIRAIHRALVEDTADAAIAGELRTTQNWIGGRHPNPRGAAFVPPPEDQVERLLDDLCRFCERDDLPPLLQAAIAHVQFETIHPFADGNGRVGRALIHVVLSRRGLTRAADGGGLVLSPISLVLAGRSDDYVSGLSAFRAGAYEEWLAFLLDATYRSTLLAEGLFRDVAALQERWRAQAGRLRADSAAGTLIGRLPQTPIIDLAGAAALTGVSREATRRAIDRLAEAGVLRELTGKGRLRRWEAVGLFAILDGLEAESREGVGRRRTSSPS